ncbi:MAG TPA: hypothetical protein PKW79_02235 [Rhabdochlamydiaceae bacterium]|nr:hypothetical protein [Rhabdochlamydiaceae bacterium]
MFISRLRTFSFHWTSNPLAALKNLSINGQATAFVQVLDFAQKYTSLIDWKNFKKAQEMLKATHAFEDATTAELRGIRLMLPQP